MLRPQICRSWTSATPGSAASQSRTSDSRTRAGTASIARSTDSRSNPQVETTTTTATAKPAAGSIQSSPVRRTASAAATTPKDTSASAPRWRNCARMFRSPFRPRRNSSAVPPFTAIPAAATAITVPVATGSGASSLCAASTAIAPVPTNSTTALASEARIVALPHP